jgi:hypothetical protein
MSGSQLKHDTFFGLSAVARFAGVSETEAKRLIGTGELPVFLAGKLICGSKAALREWRAGRKQAEEGRS